jgi:hypothetical protein
LFGDIFYSRAVIYLLRYRDHEVFEQILEALKDLHESRLELHIKVQEVLRGKNEPASIDSDKSMLIDANRLLYTAFEIGCSISGCQAHGKGTGCSLKAAEKVIMYKTYSELLKYSDNLSGPVSSSALRDYLDSRKRKMSKDVKETVSGSSGDSFLDSLHAIMESLEKE